MLTFRNTLILFTVALAALVISDIYVPVSLWWYGGIVLVLLILLIRGSMYIQTDFYMKSFRRGDSSRKTVSLTFDDGPGETTTPVILDILKEFNVKATFFVIGSRAEKHPDIIRRIHAEGHLTGGHSYSHHFFFDLFSRRRMMQELQRTQEAVQRITGNKMRLFRPPYGVTNPTVARVVKETDFDSVGWSLKSNDTVIKTGDLLMKRLKKKLKKGDIILFHDDRPLIADQLRAFLKYLNEQQYEVERIDHFLHIRAYEN